MCGIIGLLLADDSQHVNQLLFDGLTVLQHRGQDAAGIVTAERRRLHLRKDNGLVRDVFGTSQVMQELRGNVGIGHVRYPTAGSSSCAEAQPLYTNYPYGICVAHNGNITNTDELALHLEDAVARHINTDSDSELLLNLFAEYLTKENRKNGEVDMKEAIFTALEAVMKQCHGGYAGLFLINGFGLVGFRDPHGIRPLTFGCRRAAASLGGGAGAAAAAHGPTETNGNGIPMTPHAMESAEHGLDYVFASESVAIDTLGFQLVRYVPGYYCYYYDTEIDVTHCVAECFRLTQLGCSYILYTHKHTETFVREKRFLWIWRGTVTVASFIPILSIHPAFLNTCILLDLIPS
jgi:amidophosphoribosyltransferase